MYGQLMAMQETNCDQAWDGMVMSNLEIISYKTCTYEHVVCFCCQFQVFTFKVLLDVMMNSSNDLDPHLGMRTLLHS